MIKGLKRESRGDWIDIQLEWGLAVQLFMTVPLSKPLNWIKRRGRKGEQRIRSRRSPTGDLEWYWRESLKHPPGFEIVLIHKVGNKWTERTLLRLQVPIVSTETSGAASSGLVVSTPFQRLTGRLQKPIRACLYDKISCELFTDLPAEETATEEEKEQVAQEVQVIINITDAKRPNQRLLVCDTVDRQLSGWYKD